MNEKHTNARFARFVRAYSDEKRQMDLYEHIDRLDIHDWFSCMLTSGVLERTPSEIAPIQWIAPVRRHNARVFRDGRYQSRVHDLLDIAKLPDIPRPATVRSLGACCRISLRPARSRPIGRFCSGRWSTSRFSTTRPSKRRLSPSFAFVLCGRDFGRSVKSLYGVCVFEETPSTPKTQTPSVCTRVACLG
jgi:hypothetical protein